MATDYYALLKVRRDATQDEVKRAYRRLARELHPDVNPDPETQERFKEITQAYEVLSDTDKRRMYDMGVDPFAASTAGAGAGPFGAGFNPLNDLLDQFFGAAGGGATARGARSGPPANSLWIRPWSAPPAPVRAPRRAPTRRRVTSAAGAVR